MSSKLKRKVYKGIVYTEEQFKKVGQKISSNIKERVYRGVFYLETVKEEVKSTRELIWRGSTYIG